jgi:uncharacterized membrane protein
VSLPLRIGLWLLGLFYAAAGINHFRAADFYLPMMPPALPAPRELVELSGVAEFGLGIAALILAPRIPRLRRWVAWGVIALLVAIFPANLHIAFENVPLDGASEGLGALNYARLPFQAVFIAWAWLYTRPLGDERRA